ncbi:MAG: RNA-binding domain-containing protein [Candidatus Methanofastidiosia archaeon]|jgi:RNA binding exosome subunit
MIEISYILIETLCHATEDEDKVLAALARIYPDFEKKELTGYFGNPITLFKARITRNSEISCIVDILTKNIGPQLKNDFKRRVDTKGNLYIRLDKQELYQSNYVLEDNGDIKIVIHIQSYPFRAEETIPYAQKIFGH